MSNDFIAEIREHGLTPPAKILPGQFYRFPGVNKDAHNRSGYAKLFETGVAGVFGDWTTGDSYTWFADEPTNPEERKKQQTEIKKARADSEKKQRAIYKEAAEKALKIWNSTPAAENDHPYLDSKNVESHGLHINNKNLLIPVYNKTGKIISIQQITPSGSKYFLKDSCTKAGFCPIGDIDKSDINIIVEGYATGATIYKATGLTVVIAFNAGNLKHVAEAIRKKYPDNKIIIAADDDYHTEGNPGVTKANEAAKAAGATVIIPDFGKMRPEGGTDFNDLANHEGLEEVKRQIETVIAADKLKKQQNNTEDNNEITAAKNFIYNLTNVFAANVLYEKYSDNKIARKIKHIAYETFERYSNIPAFKKQEAILYLISEDLKQILKDYNDILQHSGEIPDIKKYFESYGAASKKIETTNFLNNTYKVLAPRLYDPAIEFDITPNVICCSDAVIDFSESIPIKRMPYRGEYFYYFINMPADNILNAGKPEKYYKFLSEIIPDSKSLLTLEMAIAGAFTNAGRKDIFILYNKHGNGAKNTLIDVIQMAIGHDFFAFPPESLIVTKGSDSEKRFGLIDFKHKRAIVFDEVSGTFDIQALKRYTSLSDRIRGEAKGQDAETFPQTWSLFILTNELPTFFPADDTAFLSRLKIIEFANVFYESEDHKEDLISRGVNPEHLLPCRDKIEILNELKKERAGIIKTIILNAIKLREKYNNRIPESENCKQLKHIYQNDNDVIQQFIDDALVIDPAGKICNSKLNELFQNFSGNKKLSTQKLIKIIREKLPQISKFRTGNSRGLAGVRERMDFDDRI